jgi:hypothetical protein
MTKRKTTYFASQGSSLLSTFTQDSSGCVTKDAILMLEGTLPDSKGVVHTFTADRLETIAANTNAALESGVKLPVLLEHEKTALATVGNGNNAELYVKTVTQEDLQKINPKATSLLGKAALFVRNLVIQTPEVVNKVLEGTASSVSMGLDLLSESLKEISLVGIPAWEHASLYHKKTAKFSALTWDDDATSDNDLEEKEEEYEKLSEQLWGYLRNIYSADESELKGQDPGKLVDVTLYGFVERVKKLLDLNGEEDEAAPATQGSPMPTYRASKYRAANFGFAAELNKKKKVKPPTGKTVKTKYSC